ncbi:hypothetical protein L218DRAFT_844674, partial [Marasmius fiardii PR-910]
PLRPIDPDYLHSSHAPSDVDASQMLKLLEEEMEELKQYTDNIAYLCQKLEDLQIGKQKLEDHITQRRSTLSAWRRVPVELWEDIFTYACSFSASDGYSLTIKTDREHQSIVTMSPAVLSHVCTRWKTILIERPRFWSSIDLQSLPLSTATNPILQMFLTRSARCPLDFRVSA